MDSFHERLARVGLAAIGQYGFALAGGYAVQAYGILERPSEDVDLFTTPEIVGRFPDATKAVVAAYVADGLHPQLLVENVSFARIMVTDPQSGRSSQVELAVDWRRDPPTILAVGPVLSRDDAVTNKVSALYSRGQARDYIDVFAVVMTSQYGREDLLSLAVDHDPGFERRLFAQALRGVRRLPETEFTAYGLSPETIHGLKRELLAWADDIDQ